jgi:UDP-3-O-acyl N-acetylglucosamine deacetylase
MQARRNQRTIAASGAVEGMGYWSGRDVRVEFHAAEAGTGIVFVRSDLAGRPRIPATIANRAEAQRRTVLRAGEAGVEMVEHILAALAGLEIDNCEVRVDQAEMPGCDGSAAPFVAALESAGIVEQALPRPAFALQKTLRLGGEDSWIEARPGPAGKTILRYDLDYGAGNPIGRQSLEILFSPSLFPRSLAPSRTFMLEHEAAALQDRGLGLRTTFLDLLVFDANGPIKNRLRFPDECVRHKIVDLIGDLALAGCDLFGRFAAYRSGHRLNAELVRAIAVQRQAERAQWKRCA